ncbi:hypothetical protein ACFQBQ_05525 [Granulicella cerasi]|uniref:Uncharacterized protein n=1 Tax=Granulicella cerasi TaxID=741063 RepID=A0ABW1Z7V3_9BACT
MTFIPGRRPMLKYSAILTSLMNALSCTEGYPEGHVLRSCIIGMRIARRVGLSPAEMQDLYYALLLKDAGSSFNSFRMSSILGFPLGSPEKTPRQLTGYSWLGLRRVLESCIRGRGLHCCSGRRRKARQIESPPTLRVSSA